MYNSQFSPPTNVDPSTLPHLSTIFDGTVTIKAGETIHYKESASMAIGHWHLVSATPSADVHVATLVINFQQAAPASQGCCGCGGGCHSIFTVTGVNGGSVVFEVSYGRQPCSENSRKFTVVVVN